MKSRIFFIVALVFLGGCSQERPSLQPPPVESKGIPMETITAHNVETDCWLVINNNVYNVTDYIISHPGGKAIVSGCGQDATELFETRPMGSKTPHSDKARTIMEKYYIGDLKR